MRLLKKMKVGKAQVLAEIPSNSNIKTQINTKTGALCLNDFYSLSLNSAEAKVLSDRLATLSKVLSDK